MRWFYGTGTTHRKEIYVKNVRKKPRISLHYVLMVSCTPFQFITLIIITVQLITQVFKIIL
jgi:hypothetical protein